jgi:ABC-type sugar transport system substrate-binding protein
MSRRSQWIAIAIGMAVVVTAAIVASITFRAHGSRILVVLPTADNPFWAEMKAGAEDAATSLGNKASVTIRTGAADADAKTQIQILRDYLRAGTPSALERV